MTPPELRKILYVEDDPDIQSVAQFTLEELGGFSVLICASGQEALARAADFAPDLIILDVMMPGMDGPATYSALQELPACAGTPVVFMTAKVQTQEVARYKALGAVDVISKPFDPMTLSDTVQAIWERYHE